MKRRYGRWLRGASLACGVGALLAATIAEAGTFTWNSNISGNWATGSSWIGGVAPSNAGGDSLIFGSTTGSNARTANNNFSANYPVQSLTFSGTTAYTLTGTSITLAGNITNTGRRSHTLNTPITATGAMSISSGTTNTGANNTLTIANFTNTTSMSLTTGNATFTNPIGGGGDVFTSANTLLNLPGGSVGGSVTVSGTINPSPSNKVIVTTGSNLTLNSTAYTIMEVGSTGQAITPGDNYDQFAVGGNVAFNGTLELNMAGMQFDSSQLESFVTNWNLFVANGAYAGNFSTVKAVNAPGDYSTVNGTWTLNGGVWESPLINNGSNQYFAFNQNTGELIVVPEPSTIVFAGVGMAISGWHWLSKRRKAAAGERSAAAA